jgi:dipeptidyl aminopeptidase/acylaminoacyl peptidase
MTVTLQGERQVVFLTPELNIIRRAGIGEMKFRGMDFIGDDALLLVHSATVDTRGYAADQYEFEQAIVVPAASEASARAIFDDNPRINNAIFGSYGIRHVGDIWRGYFGALEYRRSAHGEWEFDHGRPALYEVNLHDLEERRAANPADEGDFRNWLIGADGQIAATFEMNRAQGTWTIRNTDRQTIADGRNANGRAGIVGLGADGTTLLYRSENTAGEQMDWFEVPLAGGASTPFLPDVEVERLFWNRWTGQLLGYLLEDEPQRPVLFDPTLQSRTRLILRSFAALNAELVGWSADMTRAIVHTGGPADSGTWWLVDVNERTAREIGFDRPMIGSNQDGPMSLVTYTASDGLELDGVLTLPPGREARDLPVIVLPHGGPRSHDEVGFDWWAQAFASRGYAVFQPNFRGSTGRGDEFVRAGFGQWGRKMQTDISDGLAHLASEGIVDPARACIVGASYGGYAALAGVTVQQGLYRCAVAVAGVSDLFQMYTTEWRESGSSRTLRVSLQQELGPRSNWAEVSPRRLADRADAPVLLIHGRDDTVVNFNQSLEMASALRSAGKSVELVELEGEDHWLSKAETRQRMLQETMDFVMEHNPPL